MEPKSIDEFLRDFEFVLEFNGSKGWEIYRFYSDSTHATKAFHDCVNSPEDGINGWRLVQLTRDEMSKYALEHHSTNA
jgi:hypothetical protein